MRKNRSFLRGDLGAFFVDFRLEARLILQQGRLVLIVERYRSASVINGLIIIFVFLG